MNLRVTTFPRLAPPERVNSDVEDLLATTKFFSGGRPLLIHQVLSHHPAAVRSLNGWLSWGEDTTLSQRERRLLILRVAALTGCSYEWRIHSSLAVANAELEASVLDALGSATAPAPPTFPLRDAALVLIASALCATDTLNDNQWTQVSAILGPAEIIEALLVVGFYRMVAGAANALGVPDEDNG